MWRTFFFTVGFCVLVVGLQFLFVEEMFPRDDTRIPAPFLKKDANGAVLAVKAVECVPWTVVSAGSIVCLYSFTIPRRFASK